MFKTALCLLILVGFLSAEDVIPKVDNKRTFYLWPDKVPGEKGDVQPEKIMNRNAKLGKEVIRLSYVSKPTLTLYPAAKEKDTGVTVLIFPGGGYHILAYNLEGTEIAKWLNSIGVNAAVLKYRVPRRKGLAKHVAPLQDAQRAICLLRENSKEWGLKCEKLGVLGFSAGGHLVATVSNSFDKLSYSAFDKADKQSSRPDFSVLVYPAYLLKDKKSDLQLSDEIKVSPKTPPAICIQTQDDGVKVECSIAYYLALKKLNVPVEMHLYPKGGHGYGLRETGFDVSSWPKRVEDWMKNSKIIK